MRDDLSAELVELVDTLEPNPTYVAGPRWDILAANSSARALFTDWDRQAADRRNILYFYLADPRARRLYVDWEREARDQLAHFRKSYERWAPEPAFDQLLERIFARSPEIRDWWESASTARARSGPKRIRLPHGQIVSLQQLVLVTADDPDIHLVTYFADSSDSLDQWDSADDDDDPDDE